MGLSSHVEGGREWSHTCMHVPKRESRGKSRLDANMSHNIQGKSQQKTCILFLTDYLVRNYVECLVFNLKKIQYFDQIWQIVLHSFASQSHLLDKIVFSAQVDRTCFCLFRKKNIHINSDFLCHLKTCFRYMKCIF